MQRPVGASDGGRQAVLPPWPRELLLRAKSPALVAWEAGPLARHEFHQFLKYKKSLVDPIRTFEACESTPIGWAGTGPSRQALLTTPSSSALSSLGAPDRVPQRTFCQDEECLLHYLPHVGGESHTWLLST